MKKSLNRVSPSVNTTTKSPAGKYANSYLPSVPVTVVHDSPLRLMTGVSPVATDELFAAAPPFFPPVAARKSSLPTSVTVIPASFFSLAWRAPSKFSSYQASPERILFRTIPRAIVMLPLIEIALTYLSPGSLLSGSITHAASIIFLDFSVPRMQNAVAFSSNPVTVPSALTTASAHRQLNVFPSRSVTVPA